MSADKNNITDDLLVKYLLGEANAAESREAEQWINENEANRKYYADFKLIWQESERIAATNSPDEDAAWLRLQNRIGKNNRQPQKLKPALKYTWLKIAASLLLITAVGYFAYNQFWGANTISKNSGTAILTTVLPNGSSVTLNSNTQITYPARFNGAQRVVQLSGEGVFRVTHKKLKPCIIKIKDVPVSDVGTSFNVRYIQGRT